MNDRAPVVAYMVVHNEAHRLERTLMLLRQAVATIVVVDNGSTDGSGEIANRWADQVYPVVFHPREVVRSIAVWTPPEGAWELSIDADEELTPACVEALPAMVHDPAIASWDLVRLSRVYYRDRVEQTEVLGHLRLWRVGCVRSPEGFHANLIPADARRHRVTPFVAMLHEKADWEQRLDVEDYARMGVLGPQAELVRERWGIAPP